MHSYRHHHHAGNHADVLKHMVWLAVLRHLLRKPGALSVIDSHAGAGVYRPNPEDEAATGIARLSASHDAPVLVQDYLAAVNGQGKPGATSVYPGSPALTLQHLRPVDALHLFETHPSDGSALQRWAAAQAGPCTPRVHRSNGFASARSLWPARGRRAVALVDPSYEVKTDYAEAAQWLDDTLQRQATAVAVVWIPLVARAEAHRLPRQLQAMAKRAHRPWLQALLQVKGSDARVPGGGLAGSWVWVLNPPYGLAAQLRQALPPLMQTLAQDQHARWDVSTDSPQTG
ncbi:MAG: 23S rRNA (adenine(2030)-N(6))-methyltransferase RlmJ [Burkholderiaceae bacterium]|jgi:23S rRNA (adenine2030-N6)-methyltransferase